MEKRFKIGLLKLFRVVLCVSAFHENRLFPADNKEWVTVPPLMLRSSLFDSRVTTIQRFRAV